VAITCTSSWRLRKSGSYACSMRRRAVLRAWTGRCLFCCGTAKFACSMRCRSTVTLRRPMFPGSFRPSVTRRSPIPLFGRYRLALFSSHEISNSVAALVEPAAEFASSA